jgi:glycosyltransferase involved in cell wall biosynthesis
VIRVHFDDLIYQLQAFGGASVYWREMTGRVACDPRFHAVNVRPSRRLRGLPARARGDIFHSSHFRTALPGRARVVSTVHDMNYELGFIRGGFGARLNTAERKLSYFTADALICISQSTRDELLQVYPALERRCPIHVVHHGRTQFTPVAGSAAPAQPGSYVLYVGARAGYKRFEDALVGFHASNVWRDGLKLICTGAPLLREELDQIESLGLSSHVLCMSGADEGALAALYSGAHCLVYSSIHEGFGLPLLEAMSHECPVIACNVSCMPEIAGDAALLVQPRSPQEISSAILALQDPALRARLIAAGKARTQQFSWDKCAAQHMEIYAAMARVR